MRRVINRPQELPRPNRTISFADATFGLGPGAAQRAAPGPTGGDVSQEKTTTGGSTPPSVAQFGMDFVQIDFADRHLVGWVFEVVFEQLEILLVDLVDQMH